MYNYLGNHPKDRENGWSEEVNGVCHDENNWFFTQNGNLWKFPVTHDLNNSCKSANPLKGILEHKTTFHLGDFDHYRGYLFVPVTGTGSLKGTISNEVLKTEKDRVVEMANINLDRPQIFIFRADNLSYVRSVRIRKSDGNFFESLGWLAINPRNGLLYTSDNTVSTRNNGKKGPIHVYSIGSVNDREMLKLHSTLILADEYSRVLELSCMQGGCFDNDNYLHLSCGFVTNYKGLDPRKKDLDKFRDGISVFKVKEQIANGETDVAYRLSHSNHSNGFRYQFDGTGDEPEGITYWDLDRNKKAPNINGQLHAIMLNNAGKGDDDLFFKHFRRENYSAFYQFVIRIGDRDGAGTDADVFVKLHGTLGTSSEYELDSPMDDFERGTTNYFVIEVNKNLGDLQKLSIRHNNKNKGPGMFLNDVTVHLLGANPKTWKFPCNRWLSKSDDDGAISRVLTAQ